jgi:hypothetical protein
VPADVHEHRVAECRSLPDEATVLHGEVGEVPVEPGLEPSGEPCSDVAREHGGREEHGVRARLLDDRRQRVDPWLRERRRERLVLGDVDGGGTERAGPSGDLPRSRAEDDADRLSESRRLREQAERALLQRALMVLEEDDSLQSSLRSSR